VRTFVGERRTPRHDTLAQWTQSEAAPSIPSRDHARFTEMALTLLLDLHEGAIARYGLRPSEFRQWVDAIRPHPTW
jgi:hypothetical protein